MDPISAALLTALVSGVGGEISRQAWAGLSALVRRPFQHTPEGTAAVGSGEAELVELERSPTDPARAQALSNALAARAAVDPDFRADLQQWHEQAKLVTGDVTNVIKGGTFYGPAVQGRDFSGLSFNTPAPPPAAPGAGTPPPPD